MKKYVLLIAMILTLIITGCPGMLDSPDDETVYYQLNVDCTQGDGTGMVILDPEPGNEGYEEGTLIKLTADAGTDSEFASWDGIDSSNGSTAWITMDSDESVTCNFNDISITYYELILTADPAGSADFSVVSGSTYAAGTDVTISVTPMDNYGFSSWSDGNTDNPRTISMDSDKSFSATMECSLPEWTVITHFAIDNNIDYSMESDYQIMTNYLSTLESIESGDDDNNINIIVYMDGCQSDDDYVSPYDDGYYLLSGGDFSDDRTLSLEEVNSGDIEETKDMLDWVVENYPGQHYMYSVFNHGSGFDDLNADGTYSTDRGIGFDDSDDDSLSHRELAQAAAYLKDLTGRNVDLFYTYACLMGGVELAYEVRESADYILFSEEVFPADYWSYEALQSITDNPEINAEVLGTAFCDSAYVYFTGSADREFTLSLVDLTRVEALATTLDDLADAAIEDINSDNTVAAAYNNAAYSSLAMYTSYYHDIQSYMNALSDETDISAEVKTAVAQVTTALDSCVTYFTQSGYDQAGGVSVLNFQWYLENYSESLYQNILSFGQDTSWSDFQSLVASLKVDIAQDSYETDHIDDGTLNVTLANDMVVGVGQEHSFHEDDPYDAVMVTLSSDKSYRISVADSSERPDSAPVATPILVLYDSSGYYIDDSSSDILFDCTTGGIYYIISYNYYEQETCYTLGCSEYVPVLDSYEDDNVYGNAKPITTGETQTHTLHDYNDVDWLKFETTEGNDYTISSPNEGEWKIDFYLYKDGEFSDYIGWGWEGENINLSGADGSDYYIQVVSYNEGSGEYTITLDSGIYVSPQDNLRFASESAAVDWSLDQ